MGPAGYVPVGDGRGANGWLRRNSGLLGLLAVLVLCLIAGLLVGHWASQGSTKVPAKQVVEVKGLSGLAAAPAAAATTSDAGSHRRPPKQKESAAAKAAKPRRPKRNRRRPKRRRRRSPVKSRRRRSKN